MEDIVIVSAGKPSFFNTGATLAIDFNSFEALTTTGAVDFAAPTMLAVDFSSVAGSGTVDVLYYGSLANFANLQMDVVLRTVLQHFTIEPTTAPGEKWHSRGVAFTAAGGGRITVRRRRD